MAGIGRGLYSATIAYITLFLAMGALADELQPPGVAANADMQAACNHELKRIGKPVLSAKEIDALLEQIRSREKGNVLVVECNGAFGYSEIQSAIDAADDGDTIVVLPNTCDSEGRYYGQIDFAGKAITVQSAQPTNPAVVAATIIDGFSIYGEGYAAVTFANGEDAESVLDGVRITNTIWGSGVQCIESSPMIRRCVLSGNESSHGGGILCDQAAPTLIACVIEDNLVDAVTDAPTGGGITCTYYSNPTLIDCVIRNNASAYYGGGVACSDSSSPTLINCVIYNNDAEVGGGLYLRDSSNAALTNCIVWGNSADENAAMYCESSDPTFTNCTLTANEGSDDGGSIYCEDGSNPSLTNCVLWGNTPNELQAEEDCTLSVTYCDVQGGWEGEGNIDADPLFVFADDFRLPPESPCIDAGTSTPPGGLPEHDADDAPRTIDGDGDGSAIVDIGAYEFDPSKPMLAISPTSIALVMHANATEAATLDLSIRNVGSGTLDWQLDTSSNWLHIEPSQGNVSDEIDTARLSVQPNTLEPGTHDTTIVVQSSSLPTARTLNVQLRITRTLHVPSEYATIQAAIDAALAGDEVIVADGTYTGDGNKRLEFRGEAITLRSASGDPTLCVIDCENAGWGLAFYRGETSETLVSGLTVRNGHASYGGAVYCSNASNPTLRNCRFHGIAIAASHAGSSGGALYCTDASCPTLIDCAVYDSQSFDGGGIACHNGAAPKLIGCIIKNCSVISNGGGGGIVISDASITLIDCTLQGNTAQYGGGIYSENSVVTLINCESRANTASTSNSAYSTGGAIHSTDASLALEGCNLTDNSAENGAAVYATGGSAIFSDCIINANTADNLGSSIYSNECDLTLERCKILHNNSIASYDGGGVHITGGIVRLNECSVAGNFARTGIAGIQCIGADVTVSKCMIHENHGNQGTAGLGASGCLLNISDTRIFDNDGTGIGMGSSTVATLTNCAIMGNSSQYYGSGVSCGSNATAALSHCTLSGNSSIGERGCLHSDNAAITLTNCILWNNQPQEISVNYGDAPVATYCNISGGYEGEGNIDVDPRFAIPGDFHLAADSPCIDAGTNTPPNGLPQFDIDGNARCVDGDADSSVITDMGVHEFAPGSGIIIVDPIRLEIVAQSGEPAALTPLVVGNAGDTTLPWSINWDADWLSADITQGVLAAGEMVTITLSVDPSTLQPGIYTTSIDIDARQAANSSREVDVLLTVGTAFRVPSAYATIQEAIDATEGFGDVVIVADGVYTGIGNKNLELGGTSITVRSKSGDPTQCVIDCENEGRGFYVSTYAISYPRIEGFTIQNGSADNGGGIYCNYVRPLIADCIIRNCTATGSGGGIYSSSPSLELIRCMIIDNESDSGGGISTRNGNLLRLLDCVISDNNAIEHGGGVYASSCNIELHRCVISGNTCGAPGAGIYCSGQYNHACSLTACSIRNNRTTGFGGGLALRVGTARISNCLLQKNEAQYGGGAVCQGVRTASLRNCTFTANTSTQPGGALIIVSNTQASIENCLFWGNTPDEIMKYPSSEASTASHCNIKGGWDGEGENNIDADPLFVDPLGPDGLPGTEDDDLRLSPLSPCIDAGGLNPNVSPEDVDLDGHARVMGCGVDIGAYEFVSGAAASGDLNGDGAIDSEDLALFVEGLLEASNLAACAADINHDGRIDGRDIQGYAESMIAQ